MSIGNKIRELRQKKHWSQYDLAQESGVNRASIQLIETDKVRKIPYGTLTALALALDIAADELHKEADIIQPGLIANHKDSVIKELENIKSEFSDRIDTIIKRLRQL